MIDFIVAQAGLIGLLCFFAAFIGIAVWAFRPANKQRIESYRYIPLEESHGHQ